MPIISTGPVCARRGCGQPLWKEPLCARCWRLAHMFGKDKAMFAYEPVGGYRDGRDAVEFPWDLWDRQAEAEGTAVADLFAAPPVARRPSPRRRRP